MATHGNASSGLVFLHRQNTRLRVSMTITDANGVSSTYRNSNSYSDLTTLGGSLKVAQQEVVEQEIFSLLVQEAGNLPTAPARVSERLIAIDAAQGTELKFELVSNSLFELNDHNVYLRLCSSILRASPPNLPIAFVRRSATSSTLLSMHSYCDDTDT